MKWTKIKRDLLVDGILWFGEPYESIGLAVEVSDRAKLTLIDFKFGGEDEDFGLSLGAHWLHVHLALQRIFSWDTRGKVYEWAKRRAKKLGGYAFEYDPFQGRSIVAASFHDSTIWLNLWNSPMSWSHDDRKKWPWDGNGWSFNLDVKDLALGKATYEERVKRVERSEVIMPEGRYPAKVTFSKVRWKRRFGLGKWWWRVSVDVEGGIPFPGKGENSWDCGDDATFGSTEPIERCVGPAHVYCDRTAKYVLERRQRYGDLAYVPAKGWPKHMTAHREHC